MKKIVRILGVTLTLLVLASCSKDEGDGSPDTTLSVSNLKGTYKYTGMSVEKAVDLNGDGDSNNDLSKENYKKTPQTYGEQIKFFNKITSYYNLSKDETFQ